MKKLIIVLLCFVHIGLWAQSSEPEKVKSFIYTSWDSDKYADLQKEWKHEIDKDSTNEWAWRNYYFAAYYKFKKSRYREDTPKGSKEELDEIMDEMGKAIPNSFVWNHMMYKNAGHLPERSQYLLKAHELEPDNPEVYPLLIAYYDIQREHEKKKEIYQKLWQYNPGFFPDYKLNFGYNTLMSMEENAVFLANGDDNFYPIEVLGFVHGIKPNVSLVNIALFDIDEMYYKVLEEYNIPSDELSFETFAKNKIYKNGTDTVGKTLKELYSDNKDAYMQTYYEFKNARVEYFVTNIKDRPVHFPIGMQDQTKKYFDDNLYLVGLTYKYSEKDLDHIALLKRNVDNYFMLDYLTFDPHSNSEYSNAHLLNWSYAAAFIELFEHYQASEEYAKANKYKKLVLKISKEFGDEKFYNRLLKEFDKLEKCEN